MILFAFPAYTAMGGKLAPSLGIPLGQVSLDRSPNHEIHAASVHVNISGVVGQQAVIVDDILDTHWLQKQPDTQHLSIGYLERAPGPPLPSKPLHP